MILDVLDTAIGIFACVFLAVLLLSVVALLRSFVGSDSMPPLAFIYKFLQYIYGASRAVIGKISPKDIVPILIDALTFGAFVAGFASQVAGDTGIVIGMFAGALKAAAAALTKWTTGPTPASP